MRQGYQPTDDTPAGQPPSGDISISARSGAAATTQLRPTVRRFAELIEQHLCETADKPPWRKNFTAQKWLEERVYSGIEDLFRAIVHRPADIHKRNVNHATRAYILADLCGLLGDDDA